MGTKPIHDVLLTTELLEAILLSLTPQDLLINAQRVSRIWKRVIDSSLLLQQALFFQSSAKRLPVVNPLLEKVFPSWFRKLPEYDVLRGQLVATLPWGKDAETRRAITRFDASWRRMLPCQPPKTYLKWRGLSERLFETLGEKNFPGGVRMGILYDIGIDACMDHLGSFWFQWDMPGINNEQRLKVCTSRREFRQTTALGPPEVGEEFRSEAYEAPWGATAREKRSARAWLVRYGTRTEGGWLLQ
jgi:hypothetical protein